MDWVVTTGGKDVIKMPAHEHAHAKCFNYGGRIVVHYFSEASIYVFKKIHDT